MKEIHDNWLAMMLDTGHHEPMKLPPVPERKLSTRENALLFYKHQQPEWIPVAGEDNMIIPDVVCERPAHNKGGKDWFGVDWTYVDLVHAPSPTPNAYLFEEIEDWRDAIVFPDLDAIDWEENAKYFADLDTTNKLTTCVLFNGCFERAQTLMGFENLLCAMALEPEECRAMFDAIADFKIRLIDKLLTYYPIDRIVYHDDWGTNTSTFFSEKMLVDMLLEPTRRIVEYTHSRGKLFTLHCCGRVEKFVKHMVEIGVDSWESAQMAINDLPAVKKQTNNQINIESIYMDPILTDPAAGEKNVYDFVYNMAMKMGTGGGFALMYLGGCLPQYMYTLHEAHYAACEDLKKCHSLQSGMMQSEG